jgi:hypothetical protein
MKLAGASCREIAEKLGISKTTANHWLLRLRREQADLGLPGGADAIDSRKRYESVYRTAIDAWQRSLRRKQIRTVEQSDATDAAGAVTKKKKNSLRTETHAGKAAFLNTAIAALKALDKLREATAARRGEAQPADGPTIPITSLSIDDFRSLSKEQLDALAARVVAMYGKQTTTAESPLEPPQPGEPQPWAPAGKRFVG